MKCDGNVVKAALAFRGALNYTLLVPLELEDMHLAKSWMFVLSVFLRVSHGKFHRGLWHKTVLKPAVSSD